MSDDAPRLLAGGNPQIPQGDGDGPVQAYIAAMPGWKSELGAHLDVVRTGQQAPRRAALSAATRAVGRRTHASAPRGAR